jgi:error-prone DNA polymerase
MLAQNHERQLKSEAAMRALFSDLTDAVTHTSIVAERLEFSLENLGYEFPKYPVPAGETMESFLRKITWFGAEHRYGSLTPSIRRQIEKELGLINKLGFAGYFLIVWDIVNYCRENRIMVQGRGSAANSAVCYALGITAVDPVGGQLLFERFLSEGRKGWPDIDLDLPSGDRREQVIQEVYQRYGEHGAAMTANVITYRGRSAVREIGKVLNFPEEAINRFASLFSHGDYPHTLDFKDQLAQAGIREEHPRAAALVALYKQIYGLPRHLGQHSGGMVICQGALSRVMPLEQASMPGRVVCQWDKDDCEDMGIIKVDLLGLGMMAVLQDALELCGDRGRPVDLAKIPKNDEATFELMTKADTIGVFQIESRAQMATLPRMGPKSFYDVAIEVAIIRPGPIVGKLAHPYLERRNGREPVDFIHPDVKPVLERTLGVPLFQEQVLKMAMVLAGFDGNDAEELRRAMSFHRSEARMLKATRKLRAALEARDHREDVVEKVLQAIGGFALYGFPESHAISFAILAYGSAYLKVHRPVEFYTGLLNNQPMGFYSASTLIQDAKRHGIRFKAPCVKESAWESRPTDDRTIRLGLKMVRGVTEKHVREMLAARGSAGAECSAPHARSSFVCLADFRRRTRFSKEELRELASAGALNCFTDDRRTALWEVAEGKDPEDLFSWAEGNPQLKATAQEPRAEARKRAGSAGAGKHLRPGSREASPSLLPSELPAETGQKTAGEQPRSLALRPMSPLERLNADYQATGVTVGRHPMALLRPQIPEIWSAAELKSAGRNERVQTAGAVICRQRPGTAKGVVFISLEDETGIGNCIVHPDLFEEFRLTIVSEPFLKITGTVQHAEGTVHLIAERIEPLGEDVLPPSASHDFH